jgi:phosphoglycerate dehydrogenase-like enzyme
MSSTSSGKRVRVVEWVRHPSPLWNLPREHVEAVERAVPQAEILSPASREEADTALADADAVLGFLVRPSNLARAPRLRWIHSTAASVTGVLFPELVASDVVVTNARGLHADAMAEHTLGVMLAFARRLHVARDAQARATWAQERIGSETPAIASLAGSTLGLVGLGAIGSAIAQRARALGMRVLAVRRRPTRDPAPADEQWPVGRLNDMLPIVDWLVIAAPHTPETQRMIGQAELMRLRPTARLVNLGRGAIVDQAALIDALREGRLAGAALDVFEEEPLPVDSPLWSTPGVVVSAHMSGDVTGWRDVLARQFVANAERWLQGEPLENVVDTALGYVPSRSHQD